MRPNPCGDVGPVFVVVSQVGQVAECIAGKDVPRALVKALTYALLHIDCLCLAVHWSQQTSPRAVDLHVLVAAIVVCYVVAWRWHVCSVAPVLLSIRRMLSWLTELACLKGGSILRLAK